MQPGVNPEGIRADDRSYMRSIGFRSNILFAIAAAIGVVASLGRPWYGPSPRASEERLVGELPSQMEDFFAGVGRAFSNSEGTSGWAALSTADSVLAGLAAGTVVLLMLTMVPRLRVHVQALARYTAFATLGVVLVKLIDEPGANVLSEPRHGVFIALGAALVLVVSTLTVASEPHRHHEPAKTFTPPPAPSYAPDSTYAPQQY